MRKRRWIALATAALVIAGGGGYLAYARSATAQSAPAVRTARVRTGDVVLTVQAPGTLAPQQDATLRTRTAGALVALSVRAGDRVKAGQVLARQDDRDLADAVLQASKALAAAEMQAAAASQRAGLAPRQNQQSLADAELALARAQASLAQAQAAARARLAQARDDLQALRQREGNGQVASEQFTRDLAAATRAVQSADDDLQALDANAPAPAAAVFQVRQAQSDLVKAKLAAEAGGVLPAELAADSQAVEAARDALNLAQQKLADTTITAPFDGVVLDVPVQAGDVLTAGAPVLTLGVLDTLVAKVRVDETQIGQVKLGQDARITPSAYLDHPFAGKVAEILPQATPGAAGGPSVFDVRVAVPNPNGTLRAGMSLDAEITAAQAAGVLYVPEAAVLNRGDHAVVLVVQSSHVQERTVVTGVHGATGVEVRSGLNEGEEIITGPYDTLSHLQPGQQVQLLRGGTGTSAPGQPGSGSKGGGVGGGGK